MEIEAVTVAVKRDVKQLVLTHNSDRCKDEEILTEARKTFRAAGLQWGLDHIVV